MNATKLELCNKIAKQFNKQPAEIKPLVETFLDEIFEILSEGRRIEIRGFGCFITKKRRKRIGRNPRTGEKVDIPAYTAPVFKFSKEAQKIFNAKIKERKRKLNNNPNSLENNVEKPPKKEFLKERPNPNKKRNKIKSTAENFSFS